MGQKPTKAPKSAGLLRDGNDLESTEAARSDTASGAYTGAVIGIPVASPIESAEVATTIARAVELPQNHFGRRAACLEGSPRITRTVMTTTVVRTPQSGGRTLVRRVVASPQSGRVRYLNALPASPPSNYASMEGLAAVEGIPWLVELMENGTHHQKERASSILAGWASNPANVEKIAASRCIPPLVALTQTGGDEEKENASAALRYLASDLSAIKKIAAAGGIPPLVNLAQNGSATQRENASAALRCLASDSDTKAKIAEAGGGAVLSDGLAPDSDEESEVRMVFDIMLQKFVPVRRVAEGDAPRGRRHATHRPATTPPTLPAVEETEEIAETGGGAVTLEGLAPDSDEEAEVVMRFDIMTQKTAEVSAGEIPPLVELLQNGSYEEKEAASATLWKFAYANVGNQDCFIAEEGVVDRLVKLVSDGEGRQREVAAGVLGFAAPHLDADTKLRVAQDGGVEALLSYIAQHHESQCVHEGITALWGLCVDGGDSIRTLVDAAGGHKIMSKIAESGDERNQQRAGQLRTWLRWGLSETRNLCKAMDDEARPMCEHVLDRLQSLVDRGLDGVGAVQSRVNALLKANRGKPAILRIVGARTFADALAGLHRHLDLLDDQDKGDLWKPRWQTERSAMARHLFSSDISRLVCNLDDTQAQTEALILLAHEIGHNKTWYSAEERKFLYAVMTRLVGFSGLGVPSEEKWFIARHDVQMDDEAFNRGAFGKIYRGFYMNADVVVKCVRIHSERQRADFLREVKIWYEVSCHPNIAQLYGACHVGDPCFMACKYIAGGSLPEYLYRQPKGGPSKAWDLLLGVTHGLQFLHSKGIVHGDLKGDNVLVDGDTAMLTDFGMSYSSAEAQPDFESLGAIRWRAPELILEGRASFEADVYSLGMLIVEAVTGRAPWGVADDITVKWHMRNGKFMKKPQSLSVEAWGLVRAMCNFDPSNRLKLHEVENRIQRFAEAEAEASCRLYARAAS